MNTKAVSEIQNFPVAYSGNSTLTTVLFLFKKQKGFQKLYLESLVSAKRLFMMARAPTPAEKPFCLVLIQTFLG